MGTYTKIKLKDISEKNIIAVNNNLKKYGASYESFEGIEYGYFTSHAQIKEDCRFMNEDEEGLKQQSHIKRPITPSYLTSLFWNEIGCYIVKISCPAPDEIKEMEILKQWIKSGGVELIDLNQSEHLSEFYALKTGQEKAA